MKLISWNVNWIRACIKKGFIDYLKEENPDVIGLQETKWKMEQVDEKSIAEIEELGYKIYGNPAERPGYSWTAIFSKVEPIEVKFGINSEEIDVSDLEIDEVISNDKEWRVAVAEFEDFFYVTVYTPNSKGELERLPYRKTWDEAFLRYMKKLEEKKPVVFCWDLNVAHKEIDLKNPKPNKTTKTKPGKAWFTDQERASFDNILDRWFVDTFRHFYPEEEGMYTWWSYLGKARERNAGWRIDYFVTSKGFIEKVEDSFIRMETLGSDHCPVWIILK